MSGGEATGETRDKPPAAVATPAGAAPVVGATLATPGVAPVAPGVALTAPVTPTVPALASPAGAKNHDEFRFIYILTLYFKHKMTDK